MLSLTNESINNVNRLVSTYQLMINRCYNEEDPNWRYYGGRGICVCDRWLGQNGLINFIADMGYKPENLTIDREDTNGDYAPENCRWVPNSTQQRNRRDNTVVEYHGETYLFIELCEKKNLSPVQVKTRLRRGWKPEAAFDTPGINSTYADYLALLDSKREYVNQKTRELRQKRRREQRKAS